MRTENKVFSRLFDNKHYSKVDLKQDVKLSLKDDIERDAEDFEYAYNDLDYVVNSVLPSILEEVRAFTTKIRGDVNIEIAGSGATNVKQAASFLRTSLDNLEGSADELGLDPNAIVPNFNELKEQVNEVDSMYNKMLSLYDDLIAATQDFDLRPL